MRPAPNQADPGARLHKDDDTLWDLSREPVIVVTEGKFDSRALRRSLETLLPEFSGFISFIDFETANARGGIDELVQFARMIVGCGIKNRLVILFDNDTAGVGALRRLEEKPLPKNVFAMTLPSLEFAKNYPTVGPDGDGFAEVNGRGGAIELYLGRDSLSTSGKLTPVRWTGFNERTQTYQGQLSNKGTIQGHFEAKLDAVRKGSALASAYDFSGVLAIFDAMFVAIGARQLVAPPAPPPTS